jgi:hypothetical protein
MMMSDKIALLEDAAADAGLEVYGDYSGRNYFKGYAIKLDDLSELLALGAAMERVGIDTDGAHIDSLGRGYIVAFSDRSLGRK